jgi:hypothetical protein
MEEIGGLRQEWKEWKEKERKEDLANTRGEGLAEGRNQHAIECRDELHTYSNRAYSTNNTISDISTAFLAGVGMETLRSTSRETPRSRSRDRHRDRLGDNNRPIYIVEKGGGGEERIGEICGGMGRIEDTVRRIEKRAVDAEFEGDLDRVRFGRYARRY